MEVTYAPEFKPGTDEFALLERASAMLDDLPSIREFPLVKADWRRAVDAGGGWVYRLSLEDDMGRVSSDFTKFALTNVGSTRVVLARLWGKLLTVHSRRSSERIKELSLQLAADAGGE